MTVTAVFKKIIFEKNGFIIAVDAQNRIFKCNTAGVKPDSLLNTKLKIEADEAIHPKYGKQYAVKNYQITENPISFFLKKIAKTGIPRETILQIENDFDSLDSFVEEIKKNPKLFLKYQNIGKIRLKKLVKSIEKNKETLDLANLLAQAGITNSFFRTIFDYLKDKKLSVKDLKKNPYILTRINGVGFKKADALALKLGIDEYSDTRMKECIKYVINTEIANNGDTVFDRTEIFEKVLEELNVKDRKKALYLFDTEIELSENIAVINKNLITESSMYTMEKYLIDKINGYELKYRSNPVTEKEIKNKIQSSKYPLSDKQKQAVMNFSQTPAPFFVLAGYAGTGKTTVSKMIMDLYAEKLGKQNIAACALSGNAANRIKSVTGYQAYTIHSLLGYRGNGFAFNKDNPLPYKLIVLDEAGMVDIYLFYSLFRAIDFSKTKLFIIGDDAQLPPVGAGEVFANMLKADKIQKIVLDKVFRQSNKQIINVFAQDIRKGKVPENYTGNYEDFQFVKAGIDNYFQKIKTVSDKEKKELRNNINEKIKKTVENLSIQIYKEVLKEIKEKIINGFHYCKYDDFKETVRKYVTHYQVITPQKNGIIGTYELNRAVKKIFNPEGKDYIDKFDKVIHLKNKNKPVFLLEEYNSIKTNLYAENKKAYTENRKEYIKAVLERLLGYSPVKEYYETIDDLKIKDTVFDREEDKIARVFNGQTGFVIDKFTFNENTFYAVYYPNEDYATLYGQSDIENRILDLGYCFTVHKSQGSEYSVVAMTMSFSNAFMLNGKMLYTAVTRAKKKLFIIGETYAFNFAVKKKTGDEIKRNTLMGLEFNKQINN